MCAKLRTVTASNNRDHARNLSYYCLLALHNMMVLFFTHIPFVVNHTINATPPERLQQHPSFLQQTTPIARSLCEGWTLHDLHILVTAPFRCDQNSRAACAQSFAPRQQVVIMRRNLSMRTLVIMFNCSHINIGRAFTSQSLLLLLACTTYTMVLFFTHIPFVVNHTINATPPERLQQHPLLSTTNHTDRTFFVRRLNSARHPHPGHSTTLLRLEIPSVMCAKLRTMAASNNRDHARNLSYYCLLALHI